MNFTKRGNLKKENDMTIRATGFGYFKNEASFTLSADGFNGSFYIQFTPAEAKQIIESWQGYLEEYAAKINP